MIHALLAWFCIVAASLIVVVVEARGAREEVRSMDV